MKEPLSNLVNDTTTASVEDASGAATENTLLR